MPISSVASSSSKSKEVRQRSPLYKQWKTNDEVEEVVRLKEDLLAEQTERQALDEEIKILRDYVRYRSQKILKKEEQMKKFEIKSEMASQARGERTTVAIKNGMTSRHEEWSEQDRVVGGVETSPDWNLGESKKRSSLPRLWQMPWNERYELMSKSCVLIILFFFQGEIKQKKKYFVV